MREEAPLSLLLASSVHDIKNSLAMLLNTLDSVIETTEIKSDSQRQQFSTLRGEAARINNSLIYLLGLYRLQEHQLPLQIQEVYVADFLEEQIAANDLLFSIRQLNVRCDCAEDLAAYFDSTLISGVIGNVLVNAARYAQTDIILSAQRTEDGSLLIEVRDDGPGFPEKMLQSLHNHDRGIDFHSGSTNLGLYFAAEVAHLHRRGEHHGSIVLGNLQPRGSCFRLLLP
ncbi:MAG: ATP-binding protein [Verrucomicrobiaceae bacterium]|nr:ATP-binding protein [Verrucomicrobiaceae bacterium]